MEFQDFLEAENLPTFERLFDEHFHTQLQTVQETVAKFKIITQESKRIHTLDDLETFYIEFTQHISKHQCKQAVETYYQMKTTALLNSIQPRDCITLRQMTIDIWEHQHLRKQFIELMDVPLELAVHGVWWECYQNDSTKQLLALVHPDANAPIAQKLQHAIDIILPSLEADLKYFDKIISYSPEQQDMVEKALLSKFFQPLQSIIEEICQTIQDYQTNWTKQPSVFSSIPFYVNGMDAAAIGEDIIYCDLYDSGAWKCYSRASTLPSSEDSRADINYMLSSECRFKQDQKLEKGTLVLVPDAEQSIDDGRQIQRWIEATVISMSTDHQLIYQYQGKEHSVDLKGVCENSIFIVSKAEAASSSYDEIMLRLVKSLGHALEVFQSLSIKLIHSSEISQLISSALSESLRQCLDSKDITKSISRYLGIKADSLLQPLETKLRNQSNYAPANAVLESFRELKKNLFNGAENVVEKLGTSSFLMRAINEVVEKIVGRFISCSEMIAASQSMDVLSEILPLLDDFVLSFGKMEGSQTKNAVEKLRQLINNYTDLWKNQLTSEFQSIVMINLAQTDWNSPKPWLSSSRCVYGIQFWAYRSHKVLHLLKDASPSKKISIAYQQLLGTELLEQMQLLAEFYLALTPSRRRLAQYQLDCTTFIFAVEYLIDAFDDAICPLKSRMRSVSAKLLTSMSLLCAPFNEIEQVIRGLLGKGASPQTLTCGLVHEIFPELSLPEKKSTLDPPFLQHAFLFPKDTTLVDYRNILSSPIMWTKALACNTFSRTILRQLLARRHELGEWEYPKLTDVQNEHGIIIRKVRSINVHQLRKMTRINE